MLTINENAPVKSSNLKTILAALSSVAVIGAATTYIASSSNVSKTTSDLSKFMSENMHGDFDFEFYGSDYLTNGKFSKTIDQNGEWEVEYFLEGKDSSFALKDGVYMRKYQNMTQYTCEQKAENIGYGKYKYNLMNTVKVESSELSYELQQLVTKSCNLDDDLYVIENEDFGNLVVCPSNNVNGLRVGIMSSGFNGVIKANDGLKKLQMPDDFEFFNEGLPCGEHSKFVSTIDTLDSNVTEEDEKNFDMEKGGEPYSTFPFTDRKLDMEPVWSEASSGGYSGRPVWSGPPGGFSSRPSFGSESNKLDCQVVHGAGNNKGYRQKDAGIGAGSGKTARFEYNKYASHNNQTQNYNSRSFGPCWIYKNIVVTQQDVIPYEAHGSKSKAPSYRKTTTLPLNHGKYPGYNFYWGDNLLRKGVPGMLTSTTLLGNHCDWTTFGDYNSNQLTYKTPLITAGISRQICGNRYCVFGTSSGFKQLVLAHSMGTMLVMEVIQRGFIKKGPRGTIGLSAAPLRGSIGANGVESYCRTQGGGMGLGAAALNKLRNYLVNTVHHYPTSNIPYALNLGASCGKTKFDGGIAVIKHLMLTYVSSMANESTGTFNQPWFGPSYYNYGGSGSYPGFTTHGLVDKRICGLHPNGGTSKDQMRQLTNTACWDKQYCLQLTCGPNKWVCHFRGCSMIKLGCMTTTDKEAFGLVDYQHDNHVSKHSCMSNDEKYESLFVKQTGGGARLIQSNHKHIGCKYGNGAKSMHKPCLWYQTLAAYAKGKP